MDNLLEPVEGITFIPYATDPLHKYLFESKNIGQNAENLTIILLSFNRVDCTIRLLESIEEKCPSFNGKILIVDNGSTKSTIISLEKRIATMKLNCNLIKFRKNLGPSKGRNKAIEYIKTDWAMFLDNDVYFIKDIFPSIQSIIAQLGCKFVNIPLIDAETEKLFSYGGNLYITEVDDKKYIGCGSIYKQNKVNNNKTYQSCLGTFLFGGASVVEKKAFLLCGGYDEKFFIGFEDVDLSISIFKNGYKIGTCNEIGLVHDHKISQKQEDINYEKQRFSKEILYNSAKYFKTKHGLNIWSNNTEEWLKDKFKSLGI